MRTNLDLNEPAPHAAAHRPPASRKAQRRRSRSSMRGAALVEATVVIPVMLVFLGLIMFTQRSYDAKMDKQMGTRAGSLFYASHACTGALPQGIVPEAQEDPVANTDDSNNAVSDRLPDVTAGLDRSWNLVKAKPADTTVSGRAVVNGEGQSLGRSIHAQSQVACNEKRFDNAWTAIFKYAVQFAKSGGGIID